MITPNYDLFVKILLILYTLTAIAKIILGATGHDKSTKYGGDDILAGLVSLGIILYVLLS